MTNKKLAAILLLVATVSAAFGRYSAPSKVVEKEKIVYQDRIVEKKVYIHTKVKKNNKVTIRLVTIRPDGTKTIETKIFDRNEIDIVQKGENVKTDDITQTTDKEHITEYKQPDWLISAAYKIDTQNLTSGYAWGLTMNRRFLGPIFGGAFGFTDRTFGLSLGLSL